MGRPSKKDTGHCQPSILFGKAVFASKEINWQAQPLSHGYETVHLAFHSSSFNHLPASTVLRCILMKYSGSSPWDHPIEGPSLLTGGESFILLYREKSSLLRHSATRIQLSAGKIASEQLYCHLRPQIFFIHNRNPPGGVTNSWLQQYPVQPIPGLPVSQWFFLSLEVAEWLTPFVLLPLTAEGQK